MTEAWDCSPLPIRLVPETWTQNIRSRGGASLRVRSKLSGGCWFGFHGSTGFVASWRPLYRGRGAIRIAGSPFKTFAEAEEACTTMLKYLTSDE